MTSQAVCYDVSIIPYLPWVPETFLGQHPKIPAAREKNLWCPGLRSTDFEEKIEGL